MPIDGSGGFLVFLFPCTLKMVFGGLWNRTTLADVC